MRRLASPLGQVGVLSAVALAAPTVAGEPGAVVALVAMAVFAVTNPVACALGAAWWRETMVSSVLFLGLLVPLGQTPGVKDLREGATVFLFPLLLYAAMVPLGGLLRLWRSRRVTR